MDLGKYEEEVDPVENPKVGQRDTKEVRAEIK